MSDVQKQRRDEIEESKLIYMQMMQIRWGLDDKTSSQIFEESKHIYIETGNIQETVNEIVENAQKVLAAKLKEPQNLV
ncbi:hypothetical protein D3C81_384750 [compost metagenome]